MGIRNTFKWLVAAAVAGSCWTALAQTTNKPNIIIIFTDDHGFTDLGIHNVDSNVATPVLDTLAAGGALMKYGYSTAPQCVPSRAGLMSGRIQNTFGTRQNGDIWGRIPVPLDVPTIAERLAELGGYRTGMVGKWHLEIPSTVPDTGFPGTRDDYKPAARGFDEYWYGALSPFLANFDLAGNTLSPVQSIADPRNRVIVQGEAAETFIERNQDQPFFLYLALYGPHLPRMEKTDPYYLNFPALDYPNYSDEMDDIRRLGLGLVRAIDDAVGGVVQKLRDLGLEENTLILFAGDNGAQPKFWTTIGGQATLDKWTGNETIPLRGEKGSLWEGGMKVPMFAYWKNHILTNQVIEESVCTLDFTATTLKLAGGTIPPEFDGVDILPRLTGQTNAIARPKPLFWDWGDEIAIRKGDWKLHRIGDRKSLFNLAEDPYELYNLKYNYPEKYAELETDLMAWYNALPPEGQSPLNELGDDLYVLGAPAGTPVDPRFVIPYTNAAPAAYPAPLQTFNDPDADTDGDGTPDVMEMAVGRNPDSASDLAFEFSTDGDFDGWVPIDTSLLSYAVTNGFLTGEATNGTGRFEFYDFMFAASNVNSMIIRIKSPASSKLVFRWAHSVSNVFAAARTLGVNYVPDSWQTVVVPLKGHAEWDGYTITKMRLNPVNAWSVFEVDWVRGSLGDLDGDLRPDLYEWQNGLDAGNPVDGHTDGDSDGHTAGQEYVAGTADNDPNSLFALLLNPLAGTDSPGILWTGKVGRLYRVWSTPQLIDPSWMIISNLDVRGADQPIEFNEPGPSPQALFYKVTVEQP